MENNNIYIYIILKMPYDNVNFDICISSIGGVGSSFFMDIISNYKNINFNKFRPFTTQYKHLINPPKNKNIKKTILIIGDPIDAFFSIQNRDMIRCHLSNLGLPYKHIKYIPDKGNDLIGITNVADILQYGDIFHYEKMLNNWMNEKLDYPLMIIKYEDIWDCLEEIYIFLEIPIEEIKYFPPKKERTKKNPSTDIEIENLNKIYSNIYKIINNIDKFVIM
jgi:hypothetical protein